MSSARVVRAVLASCLPTPNAASARRPSTMPLCDAPSIARSTTGPAHAAVSGIAFELTDSISVAPANTNAGVSISGAMVSADGAVGAG